MPEPLEAVRLLLQCRLQRRKMMMMMMPQRLMQRVCAWADRQHGWLRLLQTTMSRTVRPLLPPQQPLGAGGLPC
jgi:hypothetical protein